MNVCNRSNGLGMNNNISAIKRKVKATDKKKELLNYHEKHLI